MRSWLWSKRVKIQISVMTPVPLWTTLIRFTSSMSKWMSWTALSPMPKKDTSTVLASLGGENAHLTQNNATDPNTAMSRSPIRPSRVGEAKVKTSILHATFVIVSVKVGVSFQNQDLSIMRNIILTNLARHPSSRSNPGSAPRTILVGKPKILISPAGKVGRIK